MLSLLLSGEISVSVLMAVLEFLCLKKKSAQVVLQHCSEGQCFLHKVFPTKMILLSDGYHIPRVTVEENSCCFSLMLCVKLSAAITRSSWQCCIQGLQAGRLCWSWHTFWHRFACLFHQISGFCKMRQLVSVETRSLCIFTVAFHNHFTLLPLLPCQELN